MSTNTNTVNNTSIPNATTLLEFANLQVAAEALYEMQFTTPNWINNVYKKVDQENKDNNLLQAGSLEDGNKRTSKFTKTQAAEFAQKWEIVSHVANTGTGFSGTLFRARKSDVAEKEDLKTGVPKTGIKEGDLVISFRSTEFIDDAARDNQATNNMEISNKGWAFGQIADMEKWVQSLRADGFIGEGKEVSVTGYSLGGHLATVFNILHNYKKSDIKVKQTFTFNGAGVGLDNDGNEMSRKKLENIITTFSEHRETATDVEAQAALKDRKSLSGSLQFI